MAGRIVWGWLCASFALVAVTSAAAPVALAQTGCDTLTYESFSTADSDPETGTLRLNGDAAVVDTVVRVTPAIGGQAGSFFTTDKLNLAADGSFSSHFQFRFTGYETTGGADGLVFVVQNVANNVGGGGGGIGYQGLAPSVGVEFDNWSNHGDFGFDLREPDANHIGINVDGTLLSEPVASSGSLPGQLDSGALWNAWVDYSGATDFLEVRVALTAERPSEALLTKSIDLPAILGGSGDPVSDAFVGFTSGTGGAYANHDVLRWEIRQCFDPIGEPDALTVEGGGPYAGVEGAPVPVTGVVSGATGEVLTSWSAAVASGDPGTACSFTSAAALSTALRCSDDGSFTATLDVASGEDGASDDATVTLTNAKPKLALASPANGAFVTAGDSVLVDGTITDAGANDTHTCSVSWASGTTGAVDAMRRRCYVAVTLPSAGIYTLAVRAADDDGGVSTAVRRSVTVCSNDVAAGTNTITGTAGADVLCGTAAADTITAKAGKDVVFGRGGGDVVSGGDGDDRVYGGGAADRLRGDAGKDKVYGQAGDDSLNVCDRAADLAAGGPGADTARGVRGQDAFTSIERRRAC